MDLDQNSYRYLAVGRNLLAKQHLFQIVPCVQAPAVEVKYKILMCNSLGDLLKKHSNLHRESSLLADFLNFQIKDHWLALHIQDDHKVTKENEIKKSTISLYTGKRNDTYLLF